MSPFAIFGVLIAIVAIGSALRGWYTYTFKRNINVVAFSAQIQKLIMANNIDRAIKLCNVEPSALMPRTIKALLVQANRPYSLHLAYEESVAAVAAYTAPHRRFGFVALGANLAVLGFLTLGLRQGLEGLDLQVFQWSMVATTLGVFLSLANQRRLDNHLTVINARALSCRNLLYRRGGYKPPHLEPLEMTSDEIAEWRKSMDYVESEAQKAGPGTATILHDSMVGKDTGVLPPL